VEPDPTCQTSDVTHGPLCPEYALFCADESFPLHGVIKRTQVLRMLKHRIGLFTHDGMSVLPPAKARIPKTQVCCILPKKASV